MKRITDDELLELSFGSKIRVIWHNSPRHEKGDEYYGVIFGDKIGYEDGLVDDKRTIAECIYNDWCMVYLVFDTEDDNSEEIEVIRDRYNYIHENCPICNSRLKIKKNSINYYYKNGYNVADIKCPCCNKEFMIR